MLVLHFWIVNTQMARNQKGNHVNIPTVRTKTSGSNSIKSKSVNTWNDLNKLFIKKQLVNQKRYFCKSLIKRVISGMN